MYCIRIFCILFMDTETMNIMHLYLVERTFGTDDCQGMPEPDDPMERQRNFVENNAQDGVIWLHSYLSPDNRRSLCLYEAPSPEAIRHASKRNGLPVDRIIEVRVLTSNTQLSQDIHLTENLPVAHTNSQ
jgi:hypothetical protein